VLRCRAKPSVAVVGTKQWEFFRKVRNDIGFHYQGASFGKAAKTAQAAMVAE
jgi:hypothetical protein